MIGAVAIVVILVLVVPALVWAGAALASWLLGMLLLEHAEASHAGSELIESNT